MRSEKADHNPFIRLLPDCPAKEAGMALMEDILYQVVVDVPSAYAGPVSARRACGDLFGQLLAACLTQLHRVYLKNSHTGGLDATIIISLSL